MDTTLLRLGQFSLFIFTLITPSLVTSFTTPVPIQTTKATTLPHPNISSSNMSTFSPFRKTLSNFVANQHKAKFGSRCRYSKTNTRLHYSQRKERKEVAKKQGKTSTELDWEHYEFSQNPKNDQRFNKMDYASPETVFNIEEETKEDKNVAKKLEQKHNAFFSLEPQTVQKATGVLEEYINDDRLERVRTVLSQRTKNCKFLFENPNNPSNVWACLRTIDSFGIQDVDVIIESGMYQGKQALSTKRGMRTAMGSAQWLTLRNHGSTEEAIREIRDVQGYKIYASDLNPNSKDVRDIDWNDGPYCIVMGNEDRGISEEMRNLADETFTLPMCGFAESFNLSVATSITLAHMSAKSQGGKGPLIPGDMDEHEYNCLYLKGLLHSLPQRRTGQALLRQNDLPEVLEVFKTL